MSDPIIADVYEGDGQTGLEKLAAVDGRVYVGAMLKISQGVQYNGGSWLETMWQRARVAGGDRYGVDWFRQAYHYLDVSVDGVAQAEYFVKRIGQVGDVGHGDLPTVVDVERGGQRRPFTRQQIIDRAGAFVSRVRDLLGVTPICYGGEYLRSNAVRITDFGCTLGWVADYNATLPASQYESIGVDIEHLFAWQYCGVESASKIDVHLAGYPWTTPAGDLDLSAVLIAGGGAGAVEALRQMTVHAP